MAIVKEHLERLLDSLQQTPQTIFDQYRDWLIQMCLTISRHIVRRELSTTTPSWLSSSRPCCRRRPKTTL